jgi:outer membrane protein assembly factor BamE
MRIVIIALAALLLNACSWSNFPFLYKPNIQQGNVIEESHVAQLKTGMNQDEVNYLLGTPVLINIINPSETQYVYTMKVGKGAMHEQKLLLTFAGDKLINIQK